MATVPGLPPADSPRSPAHALPPFIPGAELCRLFYEEAVRSIMDRRFPGLQHGAARLEAGSEVLGFDTATSMDHGWGPRVTLFVTPATWTPALAADIKDVLAAELLFEFLGFLTHFAQSSSIMTPTTQRPINHGVKLADAPRLLHSWLGIDVLDAWPPPTAEWLTAPEHILIEVVHGPVYRDDTGELATARERLRWYPHDVWLFLLASVWQRIGQEEAFPGRCGDVGDETGSLIIITARLVRDVMRLGLLMERQYAPYAKWLGTAFARLACAPRLTPLLLGALKADTWQQRDRHLADAYETLAAMHNALGVTPPLDTRSGPRYPERPYLGIAAERFVKAIVDQIQNEPLRRLAEQTHGPIGNTGHWIDSTDALSAAEWRPSYRRQYLDAFAAPAPNTP